MSPSRPRDVLLLGVLLGVAVAGALVIIAAWTCGPRLLWTAPPQESPEPRTGSTAPAPVGAVADAAHAEPAPVAAPAAHARNAHVAAPAPVAARAEPAPRVPPCLVPLYEHAREFVLDGEWSRVLATADIYKNGLYPEYIPDEDMAARLYHVCASCPDGAVAGLGQARYVELRLDPVSLEDRRGRAMPREPGHIVADEAKDRIARTPFGLYQTPTRQRIGALDNRRRPGPGPALAMDARAQAEGLNANVAREETANSAHHRSDAQNVHDHGVASGVRLAIQRMSGAHGTPTPGGCRHAVERTRHAILTSEEPHRDKERALNVLENLTASRHGGLGASEREVLALALKEIDGQPDEGMRANLMETLVKQLVSGEEMGHVVCSSGKISRIVGTFDGSGVMPSEGRPMWAVREEIGSLAARIRDSHADDEGGSLAARDEFLRQARDQYVRKLGMSETILGPILDVYAEAF
eukprot:jgi/Tetstr1/454082/TSEL_041001.t1